MRRRQLFEFEDQAWFPRLVREGQMEILSRALRRSGLAQALAPPFAAVLAETGQAELLDLCSGAGSPVVELLAAIGTPSAAGPRVVLSDLHPQIAAWQELRARSGGQVDFCRSPLDATRLPDPLGAGIVTIVNGLHHFPLERVHDILEQVTSRNAALFVAEAFPRSLLRASALAPALALSFVQNPLACSHHGLAKALLSLPVPILTLTGLWDYLASALRIHEPRELVEAARTIAPHYRWRHGTARFPPWGRAVYLAGIPS